MRAPKKRHVLVERPLGYERRSEALDRHVGKRVEAREADAKALAQVFFVLGFQSGLRGRQHRSLRVINEIERQAAVVQAITKRVEALQGRYAALEHARAALPVHVVLQVTRQRSRDFDLLVGEKLRQAFLAGLGENGKIAAVHHVHADFAGAHHQAAKMGAEFRRTAGQVELLHSRDLEESEHVGHRFPRHRLRSLRARVHVAVQAGLVAAITEVDLECVQLFPAQRREAKLLHQM